MKKQALLLSAFFILIANGWAQNPCEKYGPFDAKMYTSFLEAVKEKEVVFKLKSDNESLSKEMSRPEKSWQSTKNRNRESKSDDERIFKILLNCTTWLRNLKNTASMKLKMKQ